ncbi:type II toxin-antitoxin system VapC family toxin [Phenylobacterium aquaticum]|uniref:type II toxin-antitoxin system VapC family toxin n=1 Tax=Phenylobacterium aquaticum TaxID=1763816 RepID=UPI0026F24635|nr:type II toxin-antitoxin system VapC family toxin [Phenylobacterium aquaticum]
MIFVDASALCAILLGEPDADMLAARLLGETGLLTSAVAVYETVAVVARSVKGDVKAARQDVTDMLRVNDIRLVPIGEAERELALDAFDRYGKGRHPARLNMSDCFAYACARTHGAALLFKGDDFSLTDVAVA